MILTPVIRKINFNKICLPSPYPNQNVSFLIPGLLRINLIGKKGIGKSSAGNTIFRETVFEINHSPDSQTTHCQAETLRVEGQSVTLIDTPGSLHPRVSNAELRRELLRCVVTSAPGSHAFPVVLKVERYTRQEEDVVNKLLWLFSSDFFPYATVLFTHRDQLPAGQTIREFVEPRADGAGGDVR